LRVNYVGLRKVASRSGALLLCLVDKAGVRKTHFRVRPPFKRRRHVLGALCELRGTRVRRHGWAHQRRAIRSSQRRDRDLGVRQELLQFNATNCWTRHSVLTVSSPASTASAPHQGVRFIGAPHRDASPDPLSLGSLQGQVEPGAKAETRDTREGPRSP
jgi:hypothetical protein